MSLVPPGRPLTPAVQLKVTMALHPIAGFVARETADLPVVRRGLVGELHTRGVGPDRIDEAVLMASELIANVLLHAGDGSARIELTVVGEALLRIAVEDDSATLPELRELDGGRVGGNGLRIVDALATEWGVSPTADGGKQVWFTFASS